MNVLIVSKTKMLSGCCVGGLVLEDNRSIRLLPISGHNQPRDTPFEIGQVWDLHLQNVEGTTPPHTEDVRVLNKKYVQSVSNLSTFLAKRVNIFPPSPQKLFDSMIRFTNSGSGYISQSNGVCNYSTGFWKSEQSLIGKKDGNKFRYHYNHRYSNFRMTYVGFKEVIDEIAPNTLLRVSLARWWKPDDVDIEERCYLQLSGWYE